MHQDKIEEGMLIAQESAILNRVNIQTILQLLVEKGIFTKEEIERKREYISNQPLYNNSLETIYKLQEENKEMQYFEQEFKKAAKDKRNGDIEFLKKKVRSLIEWAVVHIIIFIKEM